MSVADHLRAFLAELALETPSTPAEALRIAKSLGLDENHLKFARWLIATGRLSDAR